MRQLMLTLGQEVPVIEAAQHMQLCVRDQPSQPLADLGLRLAVVFAVHQRDRAAHRARAIAQILRHGLDEYRSHRASLAIIPAAKALAQAVTRGPLRRHDTREAKGPTAGVVSPPRARRAMW